ncbi:hypothetical protein K0M31_012659 [Melipona bicolor]|uniref:Uncharacterized protein n=1 Tax=Melipona bicolor TaxID=60889 RepID=A0AA40FJU1_9HYME|nr:hypothetical protein K0M31_012659 [Melipona bicolor]
MMSYELMDFHDTNLILANCEHNEMSEKVVLTIRKVGRLYDSHTPGMLLNNEGQMLFLQCIGQYDPHQVIVNTARIATASVVNSRILKGPALRPTGLRYTRW